MLLKNAKMMNIAPKSIAYAVETSLNMKLFCAKSWLNKKGSIETRNKRVMFSLIRVSVSAGKIEVVVEYDRQTLTRIRKLNAYCAKAIINCSNDVNCWLISVKAPIERAKPNTRSDNASILGLGLNMAERPSFIFMGKRMLYK